MSTFYQAVKYSQHGRAMSKCITIDKKKTLYSYIHILNCWVRYKKEYKSFDLLSPVKIVLKDRYIKHLTLVFQTGSSVHFQDIFPIVSTMEK